MKFMAALNKYVRLSNESTPAFLTHVKSLSGDDRDWFKKQFLAEFEITILD